jgi:hypothetical protein
MRYLILLIALLSTLSRADQMAGLDVGFGKGTQTLYGVEYTYLTKHGVDLLSVSPYLHGALFSSQSYLMPYASIGIQASILNLGVASSYVSNRGFDFGPEAGIVFPLSPIPAGLKINNSIIGAPERGYNYLCTVGIEVQF